jgi:hypothetical protein
MGLSFPAFGFRIPEQKLGLARARNPKTALGSETEKEEAARRFLI